MVQADINNSYCTNLKKWWQGGGRRWLWAFNHNIPIAAENKWWITFFWKFNLFIQHGANCNNWRHGLDYVSSEVRFEHAQQWKEEDGWVTFETTTTLIYMYIYIYNIICSTIAICSTTYYANYPYYVLPYTRDK